MTTHFASVLRFARLAFCAALALLSATACRSTSIEKYEVSNPVCIGLLPPKVTSVDSALGSAEEWQARIAQQLEQCNVGSRVVKLDSANPSAAADEDCDIIVQPTVELSKLGPLSNNAGAIAANFAWATTYVGYFFFSDMTVATEGKLEFDVAGYAGKPAFATGESVQLPVISLRFGERDHVFSSRFLMSFLLLPALQPAVCRMVHLDAADPDELASEVKERMSAALAGAIAKFVQEELARRQEAHKLPYLVGSSLRAARDGAGMVLTGWVHSSTSQIPTAVLYVSGADKDYEQRAGRFVETSAADASARKYEFKMSALPDDVTAVRLTIDDTATGTVAYTITRARLLELAQSPDSPAAN